MRSILNSQALAKRLAAHRTCRIQLATSRPSGASSKRQADRLVDREIQAVTARVRSQPGFKAFVSHLEPPLNSRFAFFKI